MKKKGEKKRILCKNSLILKMKYHKYSGRRLLLKRGPNHSKFLRVIILLKYFCYFSLPHHILEVRISSLVQILHQQIGARRRACLNLRADPPFPVFLSHFFPGVSSSPMIGDHGGGDRTNGKETPYIPSWVIVSIKERTSKTPCPG